MKIFQNTLIKNKKKQEKMEKSSWLFLHVFPIFFDIFDPRILLFILKVSMLLQREILEAGFPSLYRTFHFWPAKKFERPVKKSNVRSRNSNVRSSSNVRSRNSKVRSRHSNVRPESRTFLPMWDRAHMGPGPHKPGETLQIHTVIASALGPGIPIIYV